jgi:two-component system, NarL family, invasion response regulator UvrY
MRRSAFPKLAVLIAEDHPTTRLGIRRILLDEFKGIVVGEAGDARTTLALLESRKWNLLILDIGLPDRHGLDVLTEVKRERPMLPVLVYSAHSADQFGVHAFRAGAAGYLTKERAPEELCGAVRTILAGRSYTPPSLDRERLGGSSASTNGSHEALSVREFQVLRLTVSGRTGKAIAAELGLSQKTVSTYRSRLLSKLDVRSVAELVRYAVERGLV